MTFRKAIRGSDLPEDGVAKAIVGGRELAVVRKEGRFYCLDGICTHEGGPLGEGTLQDGWLICPWHVGRYLPEEGTADFETNWVTDTKIFRTKVEDDYIWVDL
jgi:nitrite reductase/ring-hydroxylating ferredoxin subunit